MLTNLKNNRNFKRISSVILTLALVLTINGAISFANGDMNKATSTLIMPKDIPPIVKATSTLIMPKDIPPIDKATSTLIMPKDIPRP